MPGSNVIIEPQGQPLFSKEERPIDPRFIVANWSVAYGRFPPDPTTITTELDGAAIPLTPITTAYPKGCNNLLYNITLSLKLHNLQLSPKTLTLRGFFVRCIAFDARLRIVVFGLGSATRSARTGRSSAHKSCTWAENGCSPPQRARVIICA
jgi:hypothetical protein